MIIKPTIGYISTWPVYQGTTKDRFDQDLGIISGLTAGAVKE